MYHLTNAELLELKKQLQNEQQFLKTHAGSDGTFGLSQSLREGSGELSAYDNHPGDTATELYEREKDIGLQEHYEAHLQEIEVALTAMLNGNYGICRTCNAPIDYERLQAVPTTLYCKTHSPSQHSSDRRPVEEDVLSPAFGRTSRDEDSEWTGFDGEDAWQIVASWGNSNSPAMSENREVSGYDEMTIENDESDGYVEPFESFLATDMYGKQLSVVRNKTYQHYMQNGEGEDLLELDDNPESYS
ncbi:TraR/DksA C4-type zinc finger protein [Paenibacillus sp. N1-5-1-14]|uniref:TraR/DksA C4-type zinc finger protein n=1 Tax=Paenibacillus radicibacter TaxID=2972488 RepID=UPI0021597E6F|nr:TraR/DksA C4-type zinc finger protein [Paenibacillus radicibacter]MCR8641898.1 TraR/DksA C4-type zinc finger protein [Paenibacillus radicibacter]